ncbi:MAG: mannose-1-phosphate guanylyltransferase, partial [uncultured bacterium]
KSPVFKVKRFVEKPDLTTATAYLASGEYFWNASYFIGRSETFLTAYQIYFPEVLEIINSTGFTANPALWNSVKNIAVDYAIMEKIDNMLMVTGDIGWSDIGNWSVLSEIFPADKEGNVELDTAKSKYVTVESNNCLLHADGRMIAVLGVSDLVVVDTPDAILVCHKDKAQEVRKIVQKIKEKKWKEYL